MNDIERRVEPRPMTAGAGEFSAASYLAAKHSISIQQARDLLAEVGSDPERLDVVAATVRVASGR